MGYLVPFVVVSALGGVVLILMCLEGWISRAIAAYDRRTDRMMRP